MYHRVDLEVIILSEFWLELFVEVFFFLPRASCVPTISL